MTVATNRRTWTLVFHGKPPRPNQELRMPYGISQEKARQIVQARRAERQRWKQLGYMAIRMHDIPRLPRIKLSAVFYRRAMNVADEDGDRSSLKHLADSFVAAGVIPNDTRRYLVWGDVEERRGKPYRVELTVEALEALT